VSANASTLSWLRAFHAAAILQPFENLVDVKVCQLFQRGITIKSSSARRPFTIRLDLFDLDGFVVCRLADCSFVIGVQRNSVTGVRSSDMVVGVVRRTALLAVKSAHHSGLFGGHRVGAKCTLRPGFEPVNHALALSVGDKF
jgi:hypothetical protein